MRFRLILFVVGVATFVSPRAMADGGAADGGDDAIASDAAGDDAMSGDAAGDDAMSGDAAGDDAMSGDDGPAAPEPAGTVTACDGSLCSTDFEHDVGCAVSPRGRDSLLEVSGVGACVLVAGVIVASRRRRPRRPRSGRVSKRPE